jgi:hypothetical protein
MTRWATPGFESRGLSSRRGVTPAGSVDIRRLRSARTNRDRIALDVSRMWMASAIASAIGLRLPSFHADFAYDSHPIPSRSPSKRCGSGDGTL